MKIQALLTGACSLILMLPLSCKKDVFNKNEKVTANDFLSSDKYKKLVVEINYVGGYKPTSEAISSLTTFLESRLNKPDGISISFRQIQTSKSTYTLDDIKNIEKQERTENTGRNTVAAYVLFLGGEYAGNSGSSKILGITYSQSAVVIFEQTIMDYSGGIGEPRTGVLEATVINHEWGHLLGLVNAGTPMQSGHQDTNHGSHCSNGSCLMYYEAETTDIIGSLLGNNVPALDNNCLNDLKANGGR